MTKNQCPLGEDCDLELVCSCSLTTAWMAGTAKAQDQIKAQAAEIERLRFDLKRAVKAGVDVAASLSVECNKAALWAREQHASADRYAARIEELEAKLATCEKYRDAYAECDRIGTQAVRDLEARAERLEEALLWCSGSADFNEGGVAREGWLKVCAPLLTGDKS